MKWQDIPFNEIIDGVLSVHPYHGYHIKVQLASVGVDKNNGTINANFLFTCGCSCSIQPKHSLEPIPIQYDSVVVHCDRCKDPIFRVAYPLDKAPVGEIPWELQIPKR